MPDSRLSGAGLDERWIVPEPAADVRARRPATADASAVNLVDVSVTVARTPVLRGLSLTVAAAETIGLVGANGSGKTTLLHVLSTLLPPVSGTGWVLGAQLGSRDCETIRPRVALVGHESALYASLTLRANLHFLARLIGADVGKADAALQAVGLARAADRRADQCSHGMVRRTELARILLTEPMLLLLDEAHAGLDTGSAGLVDVIVDEVRGRGGACVVVSHDRELLRSTVDRIVEVVDGGAVQVSDRPFGTPEASS